MFNVRRLLNVLPVIAIMGAALLTPLFAQLDPRLRGSQTDFMDLFQQSNAASNKPEILTVFDFSGSMDSLMFHPLYQNKDLEDKDAYRYMKFVLTDASGGTAQSNDYIITARSNYCYAATAQYKITVNSDGSATGVAYGTLPTGCTSSTPSTYTVKAAATGKSTAYAQVTFVPSGTGSGVTYTMSSPYSNTGTKTNSPEYSYTVTDSSQSSTNLPTIQVTSVSTGSLSGPYAVGTVVTLTAYLKHRFKEPEDASHANLTWSGAPNGNGTPTSSSAGTDFWKSTMTWTVPAGPVNDPTQLRAITVSPSSFAAGTTLTLSDYFQTRGSSDTVGRINFSVDNSGPAFSPTYTTGNTTSGPNGTVQWTVPAYRGTTGGTPAYVTVTLDASASANYTVSGLSYVGSLSGTTKSSATTPVLIKPDGTPLTELNYVSPSGTLYGSSAGILDVRTWIRQASHARFKSGSRTIDIPIPWKITTVASTGSPLTSYTVKDEQIKTTKNALGVDVPTTYGSGLDIEMDKRYLLEASDNSVFVSDANLGTHLTTSTTKTAWLGTVAYRPSYISWLFNGKFQNTSATGAYYTNIASLNGTYIVYDSAATSATYLAANQTSADWGKAYGPSGSSWGAITMPTMGFSGAYTGSTSVDASKYAIPALTRVQACKRAAIQTWIKHQADIYWAFRFLDPNGEASYGSASSIDNNTGSTLNTSDATTTHVDGNDSGWKLLNNTTSEGITSTSGHSVTGMNRIASMFANGSTPLTYAMARGLAQFTDPSSVFKQVETLPSQCMNPFLILFTDGIDNNGTSTANLHGDTPYINGVALDAANGNKVILANSTLITPTNGNNWNLFTFAGIAAHMGDSSLGTKVVGVDYLNALDPGTSYSSGTPASFMPFSILKRGTTTFNTPRRITTMTVGVSLGGSYTDASSPKRSLFLAAAIGDPNLSAYPNVNNLLPFESLNGKKVDGTIDFFDATDPDTLSKSLDDAIGDALSRSNLNVTTSPSLPYIGSSLGKQIYLGKFQPPTTGYGSVMWSGDLFMFPTKEDSSGKTVILDKTGFPTTSMDSSTAVWSASTALRNNRPWSSRSLYTRLPNATALSPFTYTGDTTTNPLLAYVAQDNPTLYSHSATSTAAQQANQQQLIQLVMGANLDDPFNSVVKTANRENIMGDIINSSPSYLEYKFDDITLPGGSYLTKTGRNRFRILLVGTNQGYLHAFGETTKINTIVDPTDSSKSLDLVTGEVDELWAFLPTDFLNNLDYLHTASNSHKFMVDGSPTIYFLDLPPTSGGTGNGVLDGSNITINPATDTTHERAIALIGLRKGGRSYYALNLHDPFHPTLQWSLVPDEAASISAKNKTGLSDSALQDIVSTMGYSTSTPSIGRVLFNGVYKDVVFFGGGYSIPEIEAKFTGTPKLGRSVLAVDVNNGDILAAVDLRNTSIGSHIGPVPAGVVPFEFFLGSGMAQRAYFLDMWGGLWCWGSKATVSDTTSSYYQFRKDSSDLQSWSSDGTKSSPYGATGIRKVYQDANSAYSATSSDLVGPAYTTLPAPFLVGSFPGAGHIGSTTTAVPTAVGVAMVSGNRNDPLDFGTNKPANTRLTVVFDRQDSRAWNFDTASGPDSGINLDSLLLNAGKWNALGSNGYTLAYNSPALITGSSYYLSTTTGTKFGYYVTFPNAIQDTVDTTTYHYSKGINPPIVVSGTLYYSYFTPTTADVCTGGSGLTYSNKICDALNPIVSDTRTGIYCKSGLVDTWVNVASDYTALSTPGVQQAGTRSATDPNDPKKTVTTLDTSAYVGQGQSRYPRARVWRTIR